MGDGDVLGLFDRALMAEATRLPRARRTRRDVGLIALILEVEGVGRFAARMRQTRIRLLRGPTQHPEWGLRTLHLLDPEGRSIESRLDRS